jgi:ABC-type nitrate/sulfonate/bicarbonate transport system substrate-binding protein
LLDLRTWKLPVAGSGIRTTRAWLKDNQDTARRFVKSMVEGIAVFKADRAAAYAAMQKWWNIQDPAILKAMYDAAKDMRAKPYPCIEGIKYTMEIYNSNEMRRHKPEDFYDDTFVRELDRSGYIDSLYKKP